MNRVNFNSQSGMSLIEILVMTAISSIFMMGLLFSHQQSSHEYKAIEELNEVANLHDEIVISTNANCATSLSGINVEYNQKKSGAEAELYELKSNMGVSYYTFDIPAKANCGGCIKNKLYGNIKIKKIKFANYKPDKTPENPQDPAFNRGRASLFIEYERPSDSLGPRNFIREIKLWMELASIENGQKRVVTSCGTIGGGNLFTEADAISITSCKGGSCQPSCEMRTLISTVQIPDGISTQTIGLCAGSSVPGVVTSGSEGQINLVEPPTTAEPPKL